MPHRRSNVEKRQEERNPLLKILLTCFSHYSTSCSKHMPETIIPINYNSKAHLLTVFEIYQQGWFLDWTLKRDWSIFRSEKEKGKNHNSVCK